MIRPVRDGRRLVAALAWTAAGLVVLPGAGVACTASTPREQASLASTPAASARPTTASATSLLGAVAPPTTAAPDCPEPASRFDCDMQRRFVAARAYLGTRPGTVGVVVHDRQTGAVWRNEHAGTPAWTASTIKLAMAVDLFQRDRSGSVHLTEADRGLIHAMLHSSDDSAADTLWFRYAGADHMAFNDAFHRYGMTSLQPQRGFSEFYPYWGFQKCTADDLERLVDYVLTALPGDIRDDIVGELRGVADDQRWGVWDAGPAGQPGNKDGWSLEDDGWVMRTAGFVGPAERYTVAVVNSLHGQGGYDEGRQTDGHLIKILFDGRF
jgi:hypothetical protein